MPCDLVAGAGKIEPSDVPHADGHAERAGAGSASGTAAYLPPVPPPRGTYISSAQADFRRAPGYGVPTEAGPVGQTYVAPSFVRAGREAAHGLSRSGRRVGEPTIGAIAFQCEDKLLPRVIPISCDEVQPVGVASAGHADIDARRIHDVAEDRVRLGRRRALCPERGRRVRQMGVLGELRAVAYQGEGCAVLVNDGQERERRVLVEHARFIDHDPLAVNEPSGCRGAGVRGIRIGVDVANGEAGPYAVAIPSPPVLMDQLRDTVC